MTAPSTSSQAMQPSPSSSAAQVAILGTISLAVACFVAILVGSLTIPSLITPGGLGPSAPVIASDFGADVLRADHTGYDGQQVYAIAREFPDLEEASKYLDAPAYRMLRILTPALASVAPDGAPTVVALLIVNIVGFGLAVYAGGRLLTRTGARPLFALPAAAVLLLGVASSGVEPLAWGLTLFGLELALDARHRAAIFVLVLAALSRETAGIASAAIGFGLLVKGTPVRQSLGYLLPGASVAAWYLALSQIVDGTLPSRFDLFGFTELSATHSLIAASVAGLGAWAIFAWRDEVAVALSALVFTAWMVVYTTDVLDPIALLRVNALPIMLGVLGLGRVIDRPRTSRYRPDG